MRVIAGKFKGRQLASFSGSQVRPMMDRVKETLFNKIQFEVPGSKVLDLFSGTGSLGIEALSREAEQVVAVEKSASSIQIIKKNLEKLKIHEDFLIVKKDVFSYIKSTDSVFDIVLVDPPFTKKIANKVMEELSKSNVCHPEGVIAIESQKQEVIEDKYGEWEVWDRKDYGDKKLSFYKKGECK